MPNSIELLASTRKKTREVARVEQLLPEGLRDKSANLIELLQDYYTFINKSGEASYALNSISPARDIDQADSIFLDKLQQEIAVSIPRTTIANRVNLYKNIVRYYTTRGSPESIELFFRIIFNDSAEVYYPRNDMLIASDGVWDATANRSIYATAPEVIIEGAGKGARARAIMTRGALYRIAIVNGGSGYISAPTLTVTGDSSVTATATATISNGQINRIEVTTGGSHYAYPATVAIVGNGTGATAEVHLRQDGGIAYIEITNQGSGYTSATASITCASHVSGAGVVDAVLSVIPDTIGVITRVNITNFGADYDTAAITVTGGGGSGANLNAYIGDSITSIAPVNFGSGYNNVVPGYYAGAKVTIPMYDAPSNWEPARVIPNITDGEIRSYNLVYPGANYTSETTFPGTLIGDQSGVYIDNKGFLSDTSKLQDSLFYQKFSYVIRTGNNVDLWQDSFNKLVHPAGFKFFGQILIFLEFLKDKAKMPDFSPGFVDSTQLAQVYIFQDIINSLAPSIPLYLDSGIENPRVKITSQISSAIDTSELMHFHNGWPMNLWSHLTIQQADDNGGSNPRYPHGNYTINYMINNTIVYSDNNSTTTLGVELISS